MVFIMKRTLHWGDSICFDTDSIHHFIVCRRVITQGHNCHNCNWISWFFLVEHPSLPQNRTYYDIEINKKLTPWMKITWNRTKDILTGRFFQYYALPSITYRKSVSQEKVIHSGAIQVGVTILLCLLPCHFFNLWWRSSSVGVFVYFFLSCRLKYSHISLWFCL